MIRLLIQRIEIGEQAASAARAAITGVGSTCAPVYSNRTVLGAFLTSCGATRLINLYYGTEYTEKELKKLYRRKN